MSQSIGLPRNAADLDLVRREIEVLDAAIGAPRDRVILPTRAVRYRQLSTDLPLVADIQAVLPAAQRDPGRRLLAVLVALRQPEEKIGVPVELVRGRPPRREVAPPLKLNEVGCVSMWFMCCWLMSTPKRTLCEPLIQVALAVYCRIGSR